MDKFTVKNIDFSSWVKLRCHILGRHRRTRMLKKFCEDLGLSYPPSKDVKKFHLDYYHINPDNNDDVIRYLGEVRDKIIISYYKNDYLPCQEAAELAISASQDKISDEETLLNDYKKDLEKLKKQLSSTKDPLQIIALTSKINNLEVKVKVQQDDLNSARTEMLTAEKTKLANSKNWNLQIEYLDNITIAQIDRYTLNATKKIVDKFNFTSFKYQHPPHDEATIAAIADEQYTSATPAKSKTTKKKG